MHLSSRFRFHGFAVGAAGRITEPFAEVIEVQAATALPPIGGTGTSRSAAYKCREILQFDLATSEVTGAECENKGAKWSAATHLKATMEGLNIMGMVTADKIVANLVSTYMPGSDEPSVRLIGTHFENLRVAGIPIKVDLATDVFDKYDTHSSLARAYKSEPHVRTLLDNIMLKKKAAEAPSAISRWFRNARESDELPVTRGATSMSLVRGIEAEKAGLNQWGHVIHVDGFGTVRLAEVEITSKTRVVDMVQMELECPYKGHLMCLSVGDGGEPNGQLDD